MQLSYIEIAVKLALGLLSLIIVINISGKGNLAPTSASDQVQNYVLGGIIGGVIYSPSISILQYLNILLIWIILVLGMKWLKTNNSYFKKMIDGQPTTIIKKGKIDIEKNAPKLHNRVRTIGYILNEVPISESELIKQIEELFEMDMKNYSDGQKKKVLIAVSLSKPAHIFVWDEPLNYIDVISRIQIEEIIKEAKPTLIFVEHDKRFVEDVANKIIQL